LRRDVIVLDLVIPVDGLRAAQAIREVLPTVAIVLNTFYRRAEVEVEANKYGIQKVVDKTKPGVLVSVVEELFSAG
jgi:DNA-binding NarL/FixJ family response regulator